MSQRLSVVYILQKLSQLFTITLMIYGCIHLWLHPPYFQKPPQVKEISQHKVIEFPGCLLKEKDHQKEHFPLKEVFLLWKQKFSLKQSKIKKICFFEETKVLVNQDDLHDKVTFVFLRPGNIQGMIQIEGKVWFLEFHIRTSEKSRKLLGWSAQK
jgi:hypothetical protein